MRASLRLCIFVFAALVGAMFLAYTMVTPGWKPVIISMYDDPQMEFTQRVIDIGTVETDKKVNAAFLLYNKGGHHLRLYKVDASCGCTVPDLSQKIVAPGDFARIHVTVNTSLKLGKLRKKLTLYSNDPNRPALALFIVGNVKPGKVMGHADIMLYPKDRQALFKGECATCHAQKGIGKTGQALFQADCAMCHGLNAQGNMPSGPSLLSPADTTSDAWGKAVGKTIRHGSPKSPQMPPFSSKEGGPLSDDQVESLVTYLRVANLQYKLNPAAPVDGLNQDDSEPGDEKLLKEALQHPR